MSINLEDIHDHLLSLDIDESILKELDSDTVTLAAEIMIYAHKGQFRENREPYMNHPIRCFMTFRRLAHLKPGEDLVETEIDRLLSLNDIPAIGIEEICLLHDVVEDSEVTLDDIASIYEECGFPEYFDEHIRMPLSCLTHFKGVPYEDYIDHLLMCKEAALVKLFDLQDNLRFMDLSEFDEHRYQRSMKYLSTAYKINNLYHYIERFGVYRCYASEQAETILKHNNPDRFIFLKLDDDIVPDFLSFLRANKRKGESHGSAWTDKFLEELSRLGIQFEMDYSKAGQTVVEIYKKPVKK